MTELQDWGDRGEKVEVLGGDGTVAMVSLILQPKHAGSLFLFLKKNLVGQNSLLWLY